MSPSFLSAVSCVTELKSVLWSLTVVGHVSVSLLEDEVDSMSSSSDLLNGLTVGHSCCTVSIYLHQLVGHLQHTVSPCLPSGGKCIKHKTEYKSFQAPTNILCLQEHVQSSELKKSLCRLLRKLTVLETKFSCKTSERQLQIRLLLLFSVQHFTSYSAKAA